LPLDLPTPVSSALARGQVQLHHELWHAIRSNWHLFSLAERETLRQQHPSWVPTHSRFMQVAVSPSAPNGVAVNYNAGESFLYMTRRIIRAVNAMLALLGEHEIEPSGNELPDTFIAATSIASPPTATRLDPAELARRMMRLREPVVLQRHSLATIGAYAESFIRDPLMRIWLRNRDPASAATSALNSTTLELFKWFDDTTERWRLTRRLDEVPWLDCWLGGRRGTEIVNALQHMNPSSSFPRDLEIVGPFPGYGDELAELEDVADALTRIRVHRVGLDYVSGMEIPEAELLG
jgi:hypothetical protein